MKLPSFLQNVASEVEALASQVGNHIDVPALLETAVAAEFSGGPAAVVPAILANLPNVVTDPNVLSLAQLLLQIGHYAPTPAK